jgi:hypothetical protein
VLTLGNENPDVLHIRNAQRGVGGMIQFEGAGGAVKASVDSVVGDINAVGVYRKGGTAGVGTGSSITVCTSGACATSCSLIFSGGIRTGGTCP